MPPIQQTTVRRQQATQNAELMDEFDRLEAELDAEAETEQPEVDEESAPRSRDRLSEVQQRGSGRTPRVSSEDLDRLVTDQQREALNELKGQIGRSDLLESVKQADLRQVNDLLRKAARGPLGETDVERMEALKSKYEASPNESDSPENQVSPRGRLLNFLQQDQVSGATSAGLRTAQQSAGLTDAEMQNITLPTDNAKAGKLMNFFRQVDPRLATTLQSGNGDRYSEAAISRLKSLLSATLNSGDLGFSDAQVIGFIDKTFDVQWNGASIKSHISENGVWGSRTIARGVFDDVNRAVTSQSSADINTAIGKVGGWMGVGQEDWRKNDWNRTIVSAVWAEARQSPHMFRRLIQRIPEALRREMASVLRSNQGERNEIQGGDAWNSTDTASMVEWTLNPDVGPPPHLASRNTSSAGNTSSSNGNV